MFRQLAPWKSIYTESVIPEDSRNLISEMGQGGRKVSRPWVGVGCLVAKLPTQRTGEGAWGMHLRVLEILEDRDRSFLTMGASSLHDDFIQVKKALHLSNK